MHSKMLSTNQHQMNYLVSTMSVQLHDLYWRHFCWYFDSDGSSCHFSQHVVRWKAKSIVCIYSLSFCMLSSILSTNRDQTACHIALFSESFYTLARVVLCESNFWNRKTWKYATHMGKKFPICLFTLCFKYLHFTVYFVYSLMATLPCRQPAPFPVRVESVDILILWAVLPWCAVQ